jgi:hypothetical protein
MDIPDPNKDAENEDFVETSKRFEQELTQPKWAEAYPALRQLLANGDIPGPAMTCTWGAIFGRYNGGVPATVSLVVDSPQTLPINFQHMPLEIRNKIYYYSMHGLPEHFTVSPSELVEDTAPRPGTLSFNPRLKDLLFRNLQRDWAGTTPQPELATAIIRWHVLPAIAFLNRTILYECTLVWLEGTRFVLRGDAQGALRKLLSFLVQFPEGQGFKAIREIEFHAAVNPYTDQRLILALPLLRHVVLTIPFKTVQRAHSVYKKQRAASKEELQASFSFGPLFEIDMLEEVTLNCTIESAYDIAWGRALTCYWITSEDEQEQCFHNLFDIVKEGFQKAGKTVKLQMNFWYD